MNDYNQDESLEEEFSEYMNLIAGEYEEHSIIRDATYNRAFNESTDRGLNFNDIFVSEIVPKEWFEDPAIRPEPFLADIGRSIALGEENHLVQTIMSNTETEPISISEILPSQIQSIAGRFVRGGHKEPMLFIPARLSVPLYVETDAVEFVENREFLRVSSTMRAQVFLTSKYIKLQDLLLVDKSFGMWIFETGNFSESLTLSFVPTENENVRILAKTRVRHSVIRPEAARLLHLVRETA